MSNNPLIPTNDELVDQFLDLEFFPAEVGALSDYTVIPFSEVALLGGAFPALSSSFQQIASQTGLTGSGNLYWCQDKFGNPLKLVNHAHGESAFIATVPDANTKIAQARFVQADQMANMGSMIPYNVIALVAVAITIHFEQRFNEIEATQKEILDFLHDDKRAVISGDLKFLDDILKSYKLNRSSDTYRSSMHIKVLDIRQTAEQNIQFYRSQIQRRLDNKKRLPSRKDLGNKLNKLQSDLFDYRAALHLYGFSTFAEVLLLENFSPEFLAKTRSVLESRFAEYRKTYADMYGAVTEIVGKAPQTKLISGAAKAGKGVGQAIGKIPLVKKGPVDEALISLGDRLEDANTDNMRHALNQIARARKITAVPFFDAVKRIDTLSNQPVRLLFSEDGLVLNLSTD